MEVRFSWLAATPQDVCAVSLKLDQVPRQGELVDLRVRYSDNQVVEKSGRVKDVVWELSQYGRAATVILSP